MIVTTKQDVPIVYDAISFNAGLEVFMGNPSQTYNAVTGEFEPSRVSPLEPCIIYPMVSAVDPDKFMTNANISDVKYYFGVPMADDSNLIGNGDGYTRVVDSPVAPNDPPRWSLIVAKNFQPEAPAEIYAVISFIDTRMNQTVNVTRSMIFSTAAFQVNALSLELDKPSASIINPIEVTDWNRSIKAQLRENGKLVPAAECFFKWEIKENDSTTWREVTADELDICVRGKVNGIWGDTLTFDARFFRLVSFRCRAERLTQQTEPSSGAAQQTSTFKVAYPENLAFEIKQLAGAKIRADLSTTVKYRCDIISAMGEIPKDKYNLFKITWKASSSKPNAVAKTLGVGREISFAPNSLGYDRAYGIMVYAEIGMRVITCLVTQAGKALVHQGKAVTMDKFE